MSKYGLQIRVKPSSAARPPVARPPPSAFLHDDDDGDVERDISRQASKNKSNKDYEELHKKALEEDPMAFEYDGVFDDMKQNAVRKTTQEKQKRESKYIQALIEKSKVREREQEIVYERKIAKEREKDDHLHSDKEKFVTGAYKRKLAEQAKWLEEDRLRELREQKEDITKKGDMSDFYFNLSKNVAFGATEAELRKKEKTQQVEEKIQTSEQEKASESSHPSTKIPSDFVAAQPGEYMKTPIAESSKDKVVEPVAESSLPDIKVAPETVNEQSKRDHHKRNEDAVAAAKERFLARKRAKVVEEPL
ncbi:hypothetical protein DCAR_0103606 [Daucus carota subsp. sativus]|uniref:Nuclear speckle splicing regulatory protein 1 N-terminal domain-containing protein n=1 Tax=Daucus carota subsp. sativus TaxID=79200 RepID=A0A162B6U2_DAUCS|nr:PREDICTED: nuclear speckle splicing regulatory protein 1-like [Daucus carota subsp. sativus]WOG84423.1 hypothetical protein DCAR_0103606 [Daucus carota subsp. sativus]